MVSNLPRHILIVVPPPACSPFNDPTALAGSDYFVHSDPTSTKIIVSAGTRIFLERFLRDIARLPTTGLTETHRFGGVSVILRAPPKFYFMCSR